jgi:putative MATE family efflux protein
MALPMLAAMLSLVGFNIVDTYYVGQLGTDELAAMSFTFPVIMVIASLSMGIGVGATAVISRAIGQGDSHRVQRLATDSLTLGMVITVVVSGLGIGAMTPLFRALGAEGHVLELVKDYMLIWFIGAPVVVIPQVGNAAIRATGDTKTPAAIMITAMLANVVLDPVLIFGLGPVPALGLRGAAIATMGARAVALTMSLWVLLRREKMIAWEVPSPAEGLASWRQVLYIGLPAGLTNVIVPVSIGIVTRLVAGFGIAAVAGFGVAGRLEMFAVLTVQALAGVLIPFIGQNLGAGEHERVRQGVRFGRGYALVWGTTMWALGLVLGTPIATLFNSDPDVVFTVTSYMYIAGAGWGLAGLLLVNTASFNAVNRPIPAVVLSLLRMLVVWVPLAWAASRVFGITGIWWAALAAAVAAGVASVVWFDATFRRLRADDAVLRAEPQAEAGAA